MECKNNIKQYLLQFTHKNGNGYSIVNATDPKVAENVFKAQTKYEDAGITSIKELRWFGQEMQLIEEGSVVTYGLSLYDLAVYNGYKGTLLEFMESMKGPKGDTGAQGILGPPGPPGKDGLDGLDGHDGADGKDGKDGRDGQDGLDGLDGKSPLIISITYANSNYTSNYTYNDILTAWNEGQNIVLEYNSSDVITIYQLQYLDSGSAYFFRVDNFSGPYLDYFTLDVNGNTETWSKSTVNLQSRLTFDNIPTQNSNNVVKSSGIYNMCPIIEDGRSLATDVNITGTAPFDTLANGLRVILHFKYANTASPTLQLTLSGGTTTSEYPLYQNYNNGVNALTLQAMPAGSYGEFVFDSTNSRWVLVGKDYNTTYSNTTQADINSAAQGSRLIEPKLIHDNAYIVEESYSSGSLKANKMYDFGEVTSALTIPDLDVTNDLVSNAMNFWALHLKVGELTPAGTAELSITFPQNPSGIIVDDEPTIKEGDYVEIMITKHTVGNDTDYYASIKVWPAQ